MRRAARIFSSTAMGMVAGAVLGLVFGPVALVMACYPWPELCANGRIYWLPLVVAIVLTSLPLLHVYASLIRAARRAAEPRSPFRPLNGRVEMGFSVPGLHAVLVGGLKGGVPIRDEDRRGWIVTFENGAGDQVDVKVFKRELYNWLIGAYIRQDRYPPNSRKSSVSWRENMARLDKFQWMARTSLLLQGNCLRSNTSANNSTRRLVPLGDLSPVGRAWDLVDKRIEAVNPSKLIW